MFTSAQAKSSNDKDVENAQEYIEKNGWTIRPCFLYKEEYNECTGIRGRFHQYFVHGDSIDCSQWKRDYDNCSEFEDTKQLKFAKAIVDSEHKRRETRLKAHYANNIWEKRAAPPEDWAKPLPEWMQKKNENTFLQIKAEELKDGKSLLPENRTLCVLM